MRVSKDSLYLVQAVGATKLDCFLLGNDFELLEVFDAADGEVLAISLAMISFEDV